MSSRNERSAPARRGFTLIELLVVIAIIATLAAVIAPSLFGNVGTARTSAAKSQLQVFALALDAYRLDNEAYPTTEQGLEALRTLPATGDSVMNWKGPYLRQVVPLDPWGRPYVYISPGITNPDSYDLYTLGKDGAIGGSDENADITSWNGPVRQ
ncbi:MAG TPA: type II secretion system major pseudopilin GspG [Gemmatimonadaceae bacterium]